jgi:lipopolysaccharide transport system ATP-binding protein
VSDTVIRVENLSKKYVISHQQQGDTRYNTLRDSISQGVESLSKKLLNPNGRQIYNPAHEEFWALKDVSFEIKQGDRVGIIGRNGAGKSTLLKVLSRIVEPTSGKIGIKGRVASLLEVGTGFHPELTGRENVFLNGAILGMSRVEIQHKFDEIVAFAEVEKFLDTPVKRYSSGMYVRLAFAVAAHLEPEILIVDEVLAVGDVQFQKKCLGKMRDIGREGRTILFVSHNVAAIRNLCSKGIFLSQGNVVENSTIEKTISRYLNTGDKTSNYWQRSDDTPSNEDIYFLEIDIKNDQEKSTELVSSIEPIYIDVSIYASREISDVQIHIRITNQEGIHVLTTANTDFSKNSKDIKQGFYKFRVTIPPSFLYPGNYSLTIAVMIPKTKLFDLVDGLVSFSIEDMGNHATILKDGRQGIVTPILDWQSIELKQEVKG